MLTTEHALLTIDGETPKNGSTVGVQKGARLTLAFAAPSVLHRGAIQVLAAKHPAIHQNSWEWHAGQRNSFELRLPDEAIERDAEIVATVTDGLGGNIPSSHYYLQTVAPTESAPEVHVEDDEPPPAGAEPPALTE